MRLNQFFRYTLGLTLAALLLIGCQTQTTQPIAGPSSRTPTTNAPDGPQTNVPRFPSAEESMTDLGTIEWHNAPEYPYPTGPPFRLDGRYYAESEHGWWSSLDGLAWSELAKAPESVPAEFSEAGFNFEVFEDDGETWATLAPTIGAIRLFHRQGEDWVEVPVTTPQPPTGIEFRHFGVPAYTVVMKGDQLMTVPHPNEIGSGIVALGDALYGAEVGFEGAATSGFTVWRSEDGAEWAPIELPEFSPKGLSWAYLTAGHGRLMLSVGAPQEIWTSSDGVEWQTIESGLGGTSIPTPPLPTDFGWMAVSHGEPLNLLVSPDGLNWKGVTVPPSGGWVCCGPNDLSYRDGLFVRHWDFNELEVRVGKFAE